MNNQPPPLCDYNLFEQDRPLAEALEREGGASFKERVHAVGELCGHQAAGWGIQANENPPKLHTHDRFGNRRDEVEFHPAWHQLMGMGIRHGVHALPWREPVKGAHVARAAMFILFSQAEAGFLCPLSMTFSAVPALRIQPELAREWQPRLLSLDYDPNFAPATGKQGALCGMGMTEKQGGSDVRANSTAARPLGTGGPGAEYELTGHKWFCSAPMCDAFLVLAQAPGGLSCFLLPRFLPDGAKNRFFLQRLKDKLGNRSNASSEVEFDRAWARLLGEEGRGVSTIIEMVNHTRLDCVLGSTALMRAALVQALHHASHRRAFGKILTAQPLMTNVLADLCLESEAATALAMRLARSYDEANFGNEREGQFRRMATAVAKYWVCKRAVAQVSEALECLGGNGYVEESGMPRLFRESPLSSIWEGSGNVICLDVLRAVHKNPSTLAVFLEELEPSCAREHRLGAYVEHLKQELADTSAHELRARRIVERMAIALQAALLIARGNPAVAEAFTASRLSQDSGRQLGTLPPGLPLSSIIERNRAVG